MPSGDGIYFRTKAKEREVLRLLQERNGTNTTDTIRAALNLLAEKLNVSTEYQARVFEVRNRN